MNSPKHRLNRNYQSCRVLFSPIWEISNVGIVLQFSHQILWPKQIQRAGNAYRFAVSCSCRDGTGRLYPTWNESRMGAKDIDNSFTAHPLGNFFIRACCVKHKKHDKREPGLFEEEFRCTEMLCLSSKTYCFMMLSRTSSNSVAKV